MDRQIFFASMGGFDTHANLVQDQDPLMQQLDGGIGAFQKALGELGVEQNVITFTESEFGRTGQPSGTNGSDHAWGSHHFVIGAPVKGGDAYRKFPDLTLQGPDDRQQSRRVGAEHVAGSICGDHGVVVWSTGCELAGGVSKFAEFYDAAEAGVI